MKELRQAAKRHNRNVSSGAGASSRGNRTAAAATAGSSGAAAAPDLGSTGSTSKVVVGVPPPTPEAEERQHLESVMIGKQIADDLKSLLQQLQVTLIFRQSAEAGR